MKDREPKSDDRDPNDTDVERREKALDEALAASFPASDPPAMIRASRHLRTPPPAGEIGEGVIVKSRVRPARKTGDRKPRKSLR
jgi:hypothetical protein